ncbi:hypothetical protein Glove_103g35 [Diversispora epigaea]|uniref:Restriction endonuclease domain-containing protein n=1 Tax=Diversispora epigaea TaxID=1348612 RepID=A0A397J3M2_9GLOM|nr:hypothetical protein Glove_103g35 [Diversispora epigaea]
MSASIFLWVKEKKTKAKEISNNLVRKKYPKLPDFPLGEENLPFQIGTGVSLKEYNSFLDRNESIGYKFNWEDKNVYIIEMANREHEAIVSYLFDCFKLPNNLVNIDPPIEVYGQPYHYNPTNRREKMASDVAVCPSEAHVPRPRDLHPGPPPSDVNNRNHARIICEIGNSQTIAEWETRCNTWMVQKYVRCVFGVKLDPMTTSQSQVQRSMIAKLWTRQAIEGSVLSTNTTLAGAGVHIKTWNFGTLTGCTGVNLPSYQVTIPISNVFWDPPIAGGIINDTGYVPEIPEEVVGENFVIDLYGIQRWALNAQK